MRLDKLLAHAGYGTRKEVKQVLKKREVLLDGKRVKQGDLHVDIETARLYVDGKKVNYQMYRYFMLNKPAGVISATEDQAKKTVLDLLKLEDKLLKPFPVGRLDKDTEGLLLLTNDGTIAHELLSPKKHIDKLYFAKVAGVVTENDVKQFATGIDLGDFVSLPAKLNILAIQGETSEIEVIIQEGKFHQIKRMFKAVGKEVCYLKRLEMGRLQLDKGLAPGEYRELTPDEVMLLQNKEVPIK
ncbi:pseudouridine synthase [Listeria sp. PSOL-1]|uniref:pseudouridine synthase n=1 Tax=Listeria sp. PSOL-1 TaxID=1844999 RepID=UPI0013D81AC3|nr:pseudouridine synthase [Listeria sp. PSOL-1]